MKKMAFALFLCAVGASGQTVGERVALITAFRPVKESYTLHEPVPVELTLENSSTRDVEVDLGKNRKGRLVFDVSSPDGKVHRNLLLAQSGAGSTGVVVLAPGQTYRQEVLLNEWTSFVDVGRYTGVGRVKGGQPVSFILRIEPRDEKALGEACADLVRRILEARGLDKWELIRALSYIEDPVGVPYIVQVLQLEPRLSSPLVSTLGRIGTSGAVEALFLKLEDTEEDSRGLARNTLAS